jgi:hypothetical protein
MAVRNPITIHHTTYPTQKACKEDITQRIKQIGITSSIRETSPAEYEFFNELTKRHAASEEKRKDMVDLSIRQDAINKKALAIDIVNSDGSRTEISWSKCVTGKQETTHSKFHAALRYAVTDQIAAFREANHVEICELCDTSMDPHGRGQVDHILHFEILVDNFMALQEFMMPTEYEKEPVTYLTRFKEEDQNIARRFAEYHKEHATLRIICAQCNLKREKARKSSIQTEILSL